MKNKITLDKVLTMVLVVLILLLVALMFNKTNFTGKETSRDIVSREQITSSNGVIKLTGQSLRIDNVYGSGSMMPSFGKGHNLITTDYFDLEDLTKGDIIGFNYLGSDIAHRIVEVGEDNKGWYAITQGDNCNYKDEKIRSNQVEVLVLGVIW